MRTFMLYGALALGGCTAPEMAFPNLADLPEPPAPKTTQAQHEATVQSVQAAGDATRAAGARLKAQTEPVAKPAT